MSTESTNKTITAEREAELDDLFWGESNDPETQEWRETLNADEAAIVDQWDKDYANGMGNMAKEILQREKKEGDNIMGSNKTVMKQEATFTINDLAVVMCPRYLYHSLVEESR